MTTIDNVKTDKRCKLSWYWKVIADQVPIRFSHRTVTLFGHFLAPTKLDSKTVDDGGGSDGFNKGSTSRYMHAFYSIRENTELNTHPQLLSSALLPPNSEQRPRLVPPSQRCSLSSGLHLVEEEFVYFTKDGLRGVCIFTRRETPSEGQRGFRNFSIESTQDIWAPARRFFELCKAPDADLGGGAGAWHRWSEELHDAVVKNGSDESEPAYETIARYAYIAEAGPPRILQPSSFTLYKHVVGRRRIPIYTHPPLKAACFFCQVAADMCFEGQTPATTESPTSGASATPQLKGKHKEGINVLGIVTLHDIDMLERESQTSRGWIACTTNAVFLEKPQHYDPVIDLTTYEFERLATAPPGLQLSTKQPYARRPTYGLSTVRFTWSDVKLCTELERILQLDADTNGTYVSSARDSAPASGTPTTPPTTAAKCVISGHGPILRAHVPDANAVRKYLRAERASKVVRHHTADAAHRDGKYDSDSTGEDDEQQEEEENSAVLVRRRHTRTTLALLQTFQTQTRFLLSRLATFLPPTDGPQLNADAEGSPRA
ncbi:hypothetical protein EI94DRAFT_1805512 [Lactarius quietus]|nr:hypothetical protein EI94DRAFT_1805512 [Lactarius quietus]